jgi:hypothetical protein
VPYTLNRPPPQTLRRPTCQVTTWGIVAMAFSLMRTPSHFYVLRLLLGAAEAGAFPGM